MLNYRPDIDALRAYSILLVILYHFEILNFSGGYIGVDVFFVISGYLITNIIITDINKKKFNLLNFYTRRIKRIIPALFFIVIFSLFFGYIFLNPFHFERLTESASSSVFGVSNFYFTGESGYFDNIGRYYKPLLHTWSLSIELQFYLFWSIFLIIFYKILKNKIKYLIIIIFLLSLGLSNVYSPRFETYFFNPVLRLYEFGAGSLIYFFKFEFNKNKNDIFFIIGFLFILIFSLLFDNESVFPGYNALVPCLGACLILITSKNLNFFKDIFINKYSIYLGKISYSLYLVHWPIIVFYKYENLYEIKFYEKVFLLVLSIISAYFLYNFVEKPFRRQSNIRVKLFPKFTIILTIVSSILIYLSAQGLNNLYKKNKILEKEKDILLQIELNKEKYREFLQGTRNRIKNNNYFSNKNINSTNTLIFGDSYSRDIYVSLARNKEFSELDIEYVNFPHFNCFKSRSYKDEIVELIKKFILNLKTCSEKINNFNYEILNSSEVVILSGRWEKDFNLNEFLKFFKKYYNNKIIFINRKPRFLSIPTLYFKNSSDLGKLAFSTKSKEIKKINTNLKKQSESNDVIYFDIYNLICKSDSCLVMDSNNILISDESHWTFDGSFFYGKILYKNKFLELIVDDKVNE